MTYPESRSTRDFFRISCLVLLFAIAIIGLVFGARLFPEFDSEHRAKLKLPSSIDDVQELGIILLTYTDRYYFAVVGGYSAVYIFLQTFCIPGSIFLSFLAGMLFGLPAGVLVVCVLATIGASNCFLLSAFVGKNMLEALVPKQLESFGNQMQRRQEHLFNYMLFVRFTPIVPNWLVNIASPMFGVPLTTFIIGTFFGIMPQTFVAVQAGLAMHDLKLLSDVLDIKIWSSLFGLAIIALVPTMNSFQSFFVWLQEWLGVAKRKKQK